MARLLDKKINGKYPHQYISSGCTDIAATFRRIRKQQSELAALPQAIPIARARKEK